MGFKYSSWMSMRLLQLKYMVRLTLIIRLPTPTSSLSVMCETYLDRTERSSWRDACGQSILRLGILPLGAARVMVMETTMTWNLKYFSLRLTIKAFILREFFSIWIVRVVEFLLQKKSWWDKRKSSASNLG